MMTDKIPRLQDEQIEEWHEYMDETRNPAPFGAWIKTVVAGLLFWAVILFCIGFVSNWFFP